MENQPFSIGGAIREGWELTKVNIGFLISYQILLFLLLWLFSDVSDHWKFSPIQAVGFVIAVLGKMGFYKSALLLTKGLKPKFNQFYANWRMFLSWILGSFFFALLFGVGLIFLIVPGLIVWAAFGLFPFFILDKELGPIESLKKSAEATKGMRWGDFPSFPCMHRLKSIGPFILWYRNFDLSAGDPHCDSLCL